MTSMAWAVLTAASACAAAADAAPPFEPTMESLARYRCPRWFRDAKLGIWAHWGPQAVPMNGDWYARGMYEEGSRHYRYHLAHYGHPSRFGYKDIVPLWKAERWDPDRLMALYKRAGARYFVSMACHHDNFDLWDSKHHRWNAVRMGPQRDVVGEWQRAARKAGLRFGVSEHLGASFTWFQTSKRSDREGPLAGVPYDGADPRYEDLYHRPAAPDDTGWYSRDPAWHREWRVRIGDLVDTYRPDLLYTDGGVPFGNEVGLGLIAHFYNAGARAPGAAPHVVYTCKQASGGRWVEDLERGVMSGINPHPWQTDTSIGDWYYNRDWQYRDIGWTIHMLVDIVSKNGNLLLNVVQRPDGSLDPEVERLLEELAAWMAVHGEGIHGSRPWIVYGEGTKRARGGHFAEDQTYSAEDVRFTTRSGALYAFVLGWPESGTVRLRSLPETPRGGVIREVRLLGHAGALQWTHDAEGLTVRLPAKPADWPAYALKIVGSRLRAFTPPEPPTPVTLPDERGDLAPAVADAVLHGSGIRVERRGDRENLGFWDSPADGAAWKLRFPGPGEYDVTLDCATPHEGASLLVEMGGQRLSVDVSRTGDWDAYRTLAAGRLTVAAAGDITLAVRPRDPATWKAVNLAGIRLTRRR